MSPHERPAQLSSSTGRDNPDLTVRNDLQDLIGRVLPGLRPETVGCLADSAQRRIVRRGEAVYQQGEPVPLTVILKGYGVARRTTAGGKELFCGVAPAGVVFGWSGLASVPSSVELVALTDCEVGQWPGTDLRALAATDQALAFAAIDSMAMAMHAAVERFESFIPQDARRRVLRILAQHRDLFFCEPAVLNRAHLPGLVGTTREMTGRVLRQLESEGTVARVGRAGLRLLRPDQLDTGTA